MSEQHLVKTCIGIINMQPRAHAARRNSSVTVIGSGRNKRVIRGCEAGTPDIEVMLEGGRVLWLECKTESGRLSKSQRDWHEMAKRLGHKVVVVRSVQEAIAAVYQALDAPDETFSGPLFQSAAPSSRQR